MQYAALLLWFLKKTQRLTLNFVFYNWTSYEYLIPITRFKKKYITPSLQKNPQQINTDKTWQRKSLVTDRYNNALILG